MSSPAQPRPLALSPSRAADYRQCPLLYRFRSIDRLPEPTTVAQIKGTLVHAVLEEVHGWERPERTYPAAVGRLMPQWRRLLDEDPANAEVVAEEDLHSFLVEARSLLKGYFRMEDPTRFDATSTERYVEGGLAGGVPVRGFIDRVDIAETGEVRIVDYKTGKKPAPRFAATALAQMKFYALVWWRMTGELPAQTRLMYLKVVDDLIYVPVAADLNRHEGQLSELWEGIRDSGHRGDFSPTTSKLCGWCAFQSLCPAFGGVAPEYPGWPGEAEPPLFDGGSTIIP